MADHLTEQEIELHRAGQGDPSNRLLIARHLAVCQPCLNRLLDSEHSGLAVSTLTEAFLPSVGDPPFHLSRADLKSYVAGSSGKADQIICESHIEICEQCDKELRLLSTSRPAQSVRRLTRPVSPWRFVTPARLAAAVALIGLLTLAALLWRQQSSRRTSPQSANNVAPRTPATAQPPGSSAESTPQPGNESVASNPAVVVSLKDNNREISLDETGTVTGLEGFDESSRNIVKAALAGEGLAKPKVLDELSAPPIKLLGDTPDEGFRIIGPAGAVITERRPTLRWRPVSKATSYVVSIFDNNFNHVAQSQSLSRTDWTVDVTLHSGQSYFWEVAATTDGKEITTPVAPAPRAHFNVLDADKLGVLSKLKQQKPASHLALGLMYARFGLVSEAEDEFRRLVKENPDSALAMKLLRTVQSWDR